MVLLCIQLSGFVPEMLAMTKKHIDGHKNRARLSPDIVRINREAAFDRLVSIPYGEKLHAITLNLQVHNLFRMKSLAKRYYCEKKIDANNMVYLSGRSVAVLKAECRDGTAAVPEGAVPGHHSINQ